MAINSADIKVIASWSIDTQLLAVDVKNKGASRFTKISKSDVTMLQLFLKNFGFGKLAGKEFSMTCVAKHLSKDFTWSSLSQTSLLSAEHKAYLNVCQFANKMLMHHKGGELNSNVSKHFKVRSYFTCHARAGGKEVEVKLQHGLKIYWNPEMQVKHVKALASNQECPIDNVVVKSMSKVLSSDDRLRFPSLGYLGISDKEPRKADNPSHSLFYRSFFKHLTATFQFRSKSFS
ncbi:MAG: hypothetical protein NTX49_05245 [Chlamydiae bacterium]|nr:hypothetical protein [Chlamydiota bacterium]